MKVSKSAKFSVFFFLIFIFGVIFVVASINRTLDKKSDFFQTDKLPNPTALVSTYQE